MIIRDHVLLPVLAGIRKPHHDRKPTVMTSTGRDYQNRRTEMRALVTDLSVAA